MENRVVITGIGLLTPWDLIVKQHGRILKMEK